MKEQHKPVGASALHSVATRANNERREENHRV